MPLNSNQDSSRRVPAGFTQHSGGLASEYAREQGWGINEDERTRSPQVKQDADGGSDYDYGARDFGDSAVDTSAARPSAPVHGKERPKVSTPRDTIRKAGPGKPR
jgi:hypothetical protein